MDLEKVLTTLTTIGAGFIALTVALLGMFIVWEMNVGVFEKFGDGTHSLFMDTIVASGVIGFDFIILAGLVFVVAGLLQEYKRWRR